MVQDLIYHLSFWQTRKPDRRQLYENDYYRVSYVNGMKWSNSSQINSRDVWKVGSAKLDILFSVDDREKDGVKDESVFLLVRPDKSGGTHF